MIEDWSAGATIGGRPIPALPDMERLRAERFAKIQDQLEAQNIDGLVMLGSAGVAHTTGADAPGEDAGRAGLFRAVSVVIAGESAPHLYTPVPRRGTAGVPGRPRARTAVPRPRRRDP